MLILSTQGACMERENTIDCSDDVIEQDDGGKEVVDDLDLTTKLSW